MQFMRAVQAANLALAILEEDIHMLFVEHGAPKLVLMCIQMQWDVGHCLDIQTTTKPQTTHIKLDQK